MSIWVIRRGAPSMLNWLLASVVVLLHDLSDSEDGQKHGPDCQSDLKKQKNETAPGPKKSGSLAQIAVKKNIETGITEQQGSQQKDCDEKVPSGPPRKIEYELGGAGQRSSEISEHLAEHWDDDPQKGENRGKSDRMAND